MTEQYEGGLTPRLVGAPDGGTLLVIGYFIESPDPEQRVHQAYIENALANALDDIKYHELDDTVLTAPRVVVRYDSDTPLGTLVDTVAEAMQEHGVPREAAFSTAFDFAIDLPRAV